MTIHKHILPALLTLVMLGTITIAEGVGRATAGFDLNGHQSTMPSELVAALN